MRRFDDERKVTHPRPVAGGAMGRFLHDARGSLKHEVVNLTRSEIALVGNVFTESVSSTGVEFYACAVLANHVHVVAGRHEEGYERILSRLKGRSSQRIRQARGLAVVQDRKDRVPIWTQGYWSRYIDHLSQMECAIEYVRKNPVREGMGVQKWGFISEFSE